MRKILLLLLSALTALMPVQAATPPHPTTDWTRVVTQTADGAYIVGNPKAPNHLIEYVSYTCSHCAHFMAEASGPLASNWVRRGTMSLEVRHAIRDPFDMTAALLTRCGGKARFFADHSAMFANYTPWLTKVEAFAKAHPTPEGKTPGEQLITIANGTGLTEFMAKRGLPVARQKICLTNDAAIKQLAAMADNAWNTVDIGGTPAFALDGTLVVGAHDWDNLRPALPLLPN